jgi:hypothetical protein
VTVLPYVLVKAKIDRLLAHVNYIEAFHFCTNDGDPIEVYRTNLKIAVERIRDFKLEGEDPLEAISLNEGKSGDFELVEESKSKSPDHGADQ